MSEATTEAKATEPKATTKAKTTVKVEEIKTVAYIGPTIPGVATSGTIFNNGLPEPLQKAMAAEPTIKNLVVEMSKLSAEMNSLNDKNSVASICYRKTEEYIKKGE